MDEKQLQERIRELIVQLGAGNWTMIETDINVREKAIGELVQMGGVSVPELIRELKILILNQIKMPRITYEDLEGTERRRKSGILLVLVKIGESAVPALIETLKDENQDVRQFAAQALNDIAGKIEPQKRIPIVNHIIKFTRSDWFLEEMAKNSPSYVYTAKTIAKLLSRIKTAETQELTLDPKIPAPAGGKGKARVRRAIAVC